MNVEDSKPKHRHFRDMEYSITEKTISGVHISPGSADISQERWDNKLLFDSVLSQQHLCQKLS